MLLQALISIDPVRARDDPVVLKNIPYYKAKKALEAEVMKLDPPPRPQNWGVSILYVTVDIVMNLQKFPYLLNCVLLPSCVLLFVGLHPSSC